MNFFLEFCAHDSIEAFPQEDCVMWALDRDTFRKIMMSTGKQDMSQRVEFLNKVWPCTCYVLEAPLHLHDWYAIITDDCETA
jgi:hypothetical protein